MRSVVGTIRSLVFRRCAAPEPSTPGAVPVLAPGDLQDPQLRKAYQLVRDGNCSEGFILLNQLKARHASLLNTDYLRALCFLSNSQNLAAIESLKEELRYFPGNKPASDLLAQLQAQQPALASNGNEEFLEILKVIRPYTMVGEARLHSLFNLAKSVCQENVAGAFVECGVAAGGSSALLASVIARYSKTPRRLFSCDTFEGMPKSSAQDTHSGQQAEETGWGAGTCAAPVASLQAICRELKVQHLVEPVRGLFSDTLPGARQRIGPIAFLHVDGDWYESTRDVLDNLYDQVVPGGRIQIDDYGYWEGCRRAVEEFAARKGLRFDFHRIDETGVWMEKPGGGVKGSFSSADSAKLKMLNLGCGSHWHADWANVDVATSDPHVLQHDIQKQLPFSDSTFHVVYHSHVLEHLSRGQAPCLMRECHRVLTPGGILRVVVPDLEQIARLYLKYLDRSVAGDAEAEKRHHWMTLELLDQLTREHSGGEMLRYWQQKPMPAEDLVIERMGQEVRPFLEKARSSKNDAAADGGAPLDPLTIGRFRQSGEVHKWMYDRVSLRKLFAETGFENIRVCAANESRITGFNNYQLDIMPDGTTRKPDSLFMEAEKPGGAG